MSEQAIIKFLKRNQFHIAMFFWVKGIVTNLPSVSIDKAVDNFIRQNGTLGQDPNIPSLVREYHRMNTEYLEMQKTDEEPRKNLSQE